MDRGIALETYELRAAFAARIATMYGREVPAYDTLVDIAGQVNAGVVARSGSAAQRLGSIERVTAERHGAIRVGTPAELRQVSRIFRALGMFPVGFYDLRDAAASAVPVVSTAFRPVDAGELARNPFRMFTSVLVTDDRRFFSPDLQQRLDTFLSRRILFPPELLDLAERAVAAAGLEPDEAEKFLTLAVDSFELSTDPVDRAWYEELSAVSSVAADIGGVSSTHINHLTPRVLDIDELYRRMNERGIEMIDVIQGPPRWDGPDVLLRQTSFRALSEPRRFREPDGSVHEGTLRVRFGEVEARGIALTPAGQARYQAALSAIDQSDQPPETVWAQLFPATEVGLLRDGLAYFEFAGTPAGPLADISPTALAELVETGAVQANPIVYEDFLPRSAAGIFQSNLTTNGSKHAEVDGSPRDAGWLSGIIDADVVQPTDLYAAQQAASLIS
jgi:uncharacterized glyoxalase superfamily metalloenzyme YdcJ